MEKSRSIKELLQLMLDNVEHINEKNVCSGMCSLVHKMQNTLVRGGLPTINYEEACDILHYLIKNKPLGAPEWWWAPFDHKPRKKWLQKQIKKL